MRRRSISILIVVLLGGLGVFVPSAAAQSQTWELPQHLSVKDNGPRRIQPNLRFRNSQFSNLDSPMPRASHIISFSSDAMEVCYTRREP
jgi:hypothetical protein